MMASRFINKPKRTNVASSFTPFLRGDPTYESFEIATLEVILAEEMKNKPWLTQSLTATFKLGKPISEDEKRRFENATDVSKAQRNIVQVATRCTDLKQVLKIREGQKMLATRTVSSSCLSGQDESIHVRAKCRLAVDRLASIVEKSGRLKIDVDENDPTQLANNIYNSLMFSCRTTYSETLCWDLLNDKTVGRDSLSSIKYSENLVHLEILYQHLNSLQKKLLNCLLSFKNQRGGWKTDVMILFKSCDCSKVNLPLPENGDKIDIKRIKYQVSNLNIITEIVTDDELDLKIDESKKLLSSLKRI